MYDPCESFTLLRWLQEHPLRADLKLASQGDAAAGFHSLFFALREDI